MQRAQREVRFVCKLLELIAQLFQALGWNRLKVEAAEGLVGFDQNSPRSSSLPCRLGCDLFCFLCRLCCSVRACGHWRLSCGGGKDQGLFDSDSPLHHLWDGLLCLSSRH